MSLEEQVKDQICSRSYSEMEAANLDTFCPSWDDKTILLVDDQIDVLITIKTMLQTCGYAVDAFNDPAWLQDSNFWYDTAMSGLEFIKNIRTVNPEIITFIITALDNIKDFSTDLLYDSTVLQLDGIIHKPILLADLCRSVGNRR